MGYGMAEPLDSIPLLYVGRDSAVATDTATGLERENKRFAVDIETDPEAALDRLIEADFGCLIAEYGLEREDGATFLSAVRETHPELPVIFLVESNPAGLAESALEAGATDIAQVERDTDGYTLLAKRVKTAVEQHGTGQEPPYQKAIKNIPVGVYRSALEADGDIVGANPAFAGLFETDSVFELLETDAVGLYRDPTDREELRRRLENDGIVRAMEVPAETIDGETLWVSITAVRTDGEGRTYADGVVRDIDTRKEQETELSQFHRAVESSGHSVYFTDRGGNITYVNGAFEETTGYSAEEAIGQTPRILKSGEHDREFYETLWGTILSGDVWHDEIVNRTKGGQRYVADQTIAPVEGPDGDIEHFVAINIDITERKRREQTLEQFRSAVEHAGHAVLITDEHGTIEYVNDAFEEISGYSAAEAIGESPSMLKSGEHDRAFYDELWETIRSGSIWRGEVTNKGKNGERYIVDQTIAPITDRGKTSGFVAINHDMTELKAYENKLEEQNERLKQYGHSVAHDLRNPLTLLNGKLADFEATVEENGVDKELVRERCRNIREVLDRMELLVDDLLTMAEQGQQVLESEPISTDMVAKEAWEQVETNGATFETTDTLIEADPDRLRELLSNLFRNAMEHAGRDSLVRVGPLDFVEGFFVEDDGPGIPEDERERVLERGFTTNKEGTGFGLAIVEQIANAHGWTVTVTESHEGGARFEFRAEAKASGE
jgi:PAS domain S-box-containing protein